MNPHYPDDCQNPEFDPVKTQTQPATKPAHTPTPWAFRKNGTRLIIDGPNSRMVAETIEYVPSEGEAAANAALIVRAVNSHETVCGLLAECEDLVDATTAHRIREVLRQVRGA